MIRWFIFVCYNSEFARTGSIGLNLLGFFSEDRFSALGRVSARFSFQAVVYARHSDFAILCKE